MKSVTWEIYTLADPRTADVRYVGATVRSAMRRLTEHLSRAKRLPRTHRDCWISSLRKNGLKPVLTVIETGSGDGWQERERHWIATFRAITGLVNHTDGGDGTPGAIMTDAARLKLSKALSGKRYADDRIPGMLGKHHSPEAIEKIRSASQGRAISAEHKLQISKARKGKRLLFEHVAKIAAAKRGVFLTPEHKQKIAASITTRREVVCVETGDVYPSITAAARSLNVSEASINQAIRKGFRCRGYHLKFP